MNKKLSSSLIYAGFIVWYLAGVLSLISLLRDFSNYRSVMSYPFLLANLVGLGVVIFLSVKYREKSTLSIASKAVFYIAFIANAIFALVIINLN